jgi:hypothetical protein
MDALYQVYLRWQDITERPIMPTEFEIVDACDYRKGDYIGVVVGLTDMYLGIEFDGYTHS